MADHPQYKNIALLLLAALLLILLGWGGGAGQPLDVAVIRHFVDWRTAHPQAEGVIILLTYVGSAETLLAATALGAAWLWWRSKRRRMTGLLVTVLGGRLAIELLKLIVHRPRPNLDAHPVPVFSQSFPSGHAGNTMLTFLALALYLAPPRWRAPAVGAAVAGSLAIGATRPVLGVHWPSDVLGGWIFGAAFVSLLWATFYRWPRSAA
ncbi:hypothetical protein GCM10022280_20810 [Sphingomonas swuensis]|uniref:Phosphatidic acid phosphatase type 2/haloperoxidase domain-containing protein n=1 Tax=Sphingomonas swuensis TaxID=977800 RepID=A0ABP7T2W8_9SPHN